MCVVSMVSDWGRHWTLPMTLPSAPLPGSDNPHSGGAGGMLSGIFWSTEMLQQFQDLLKRVKEIEDKLSVEPCLDPRKQEYLEDIARRLNARRHETKKDEVGQCKHCGLKSDFWNEGQLCPARANAI